MILVKRRRNNYKSTLYAKWIGYKCAYPGCSSGVNTEVHHILPHKDGGKDEYWNYISLCLKCHRGLGLHSHHKDKDLELFTYKCMQELELWGFTLDEQDDRYYDNLKRLLSLNVEDHKEG